VEGRYIIHSLDRDFEIVFMPPQIKYFLSNTSVYIASWDCDLKKIYNIISDWTEELGLKIKY
jgi:hypothetical protein